MLKRLEEALADRDCIHAVIKGTAINNDGSHKVGYTAPGVEGQRQVIRAALAVAGCRADTIGYLEAHGTGTLIGDPIEVAAVRGHFARTPRRGYCAIGSVKTNLGHLDAAAGVTGLMKAALAVKHGVVPPSLHGGPPNPRIDFETSPFFVNTSRREWRPPHPRRAGVSAFGIGGTNAHAVVEQPPALDEAVARRAPNCSCSRRRRPPRWRRRAAHWPIALQRRPRRASTTSRSRCATGAPPSRTAARWWRERPTTPPRRLRDGAAGPPSLQSGATGPARWCSCSRARARSTAGMGAGLPASFTVARAELDRCARWRGRRGGPASAARRGSRRRGVDRGCATHALAQPAMFVCRYALGASSWTGACRRPR